MKVMPEDLMDLVVEADAFHRQSTGQPPSHRALWKRVWVEPWFNLLGHFIGAGLLLLPWPLYRRAVQGLNGLMGGRPEENTEAIESQRRDLVTVMLRLREATGRRPAVLVFTSHPDTVGPLAWIRFEL